ncbi:unnamed protein product [Symbiodinium necroappetens]|uniref:Uncharacterized protein n=1 Tax=Symbiodinium necroappetens TaxID=1628268 RepID=A0A813ASS1_9DINO|nr:unnamed protein product [Symbiodinium necroappetens]
MEEAGRLLSTIELDEFTIKEVQNGWETVEKRLGGAKAAGEEVFGKLKNEVPKTQGMLTRSSTVWHLTSELMQSLDEPKLVQKRLEYIALRHMNADITTADVEVFRNILFEVCASKLGGLMTPEFQFGLGQIVVAVGTSLAKTHEHYAARLKLLTTCWKEVNANGDDEQEGQGHGNAVQENPEEEGEKENQTEQAKPDSPRNADAGGSKEIEKGEKEAEQEGHGAWKDNSNMNIPKTFAAMARFNAAVMGTGDRMWFADMLYAMESLVPYIGNIDRVQEDCDVLTLTLAKYEKVNLKEFRSVMFASLRSLLPTTWSSEHENAWAWFWGIVEKKVEENKQLPVHNHQCLRTFLARMDEETLADFKLKVFDTFFATTEESQLYLRAANKRLMYIMGRILTIMSDIYTKTHQAVIALSALGLLHAGHGVPEDLVRPFVQAFMGGIKQNCPDESLHDGLWWTLDLIGRIFIRTLAEGSTPVIIAINRNTSKAMKTAVANYPRGEREVILLKVQVGTESMSPLIWAIEKGALESAKEILNDLLTMRADRARYYYGMEMLFTRHSDIISLLCTKAPSLLPTLFDGLIWRSKNVKNGMRRANYYIASLLRDENGQLTDSLLDLIKQGDPEIICHPTVVFQADLLWTRLCCLPWALTKCWFCLTLVLYVMAEQQAIVSSDPLSTDRFTVIACRALLYVCSLGQLFAKHAFQTYRAVRQKEMTRYCCMPVPKYVLRTRQELIEVLLLLLLLCLLCIEPALHCLAVSSEFLIDCCEYGEWQCNLMHSYNRLAAFPMVLYFILASELVHLNVHLSVFSVICSSLMWEFLLYVAVLIFFTAAFASAVACLPQSMGSDSVQMRDFFSWPIAFESLLSMAFNTYGSDNYEQIAQEDEPMLKWFVMGFAACWHVYLMNLMVAQLCQRYNEIFHDARGNARLTRGINIYETSMPLISKKRWTAFVESLRLEEACELDEGDNGPRGAVPTTEDPYDYLQYPKVTLDRVQRYGGLANPELPWPSLEEANDDSAVGKLTRMTQAKFEEMDRLMVDMAIKLQVRPPGTAGGTNTFAASHASQQSQQRDESKQVDHDQDHDALKESTEDVADELGLNERTANELLEERTEEGETLATTPYGINPSENRSPSAVQT